MYVYSFQNKSSQNEWIQTASIFFAIWMCRFNIAFHIETYCEMIAFAKAKTKIERNDFFCPDSNPTLHTFCRLVMVQGARRFFIGYRISCHYIAVHYTLHRIFLFSQSDLWMPLLSPRTIWTLLFKTAPYKLHQSSGLRSCGNLYCHCWVHLKILKSTRREVYM